MSLQIRRPAFIARSVTLGTLFNIVFGTLWVGNGLHAFQTMQTLFLFAALAVVSTTLLVACLRLFIPMCVLTDYIVPRPHASLAIQIYHLERILVSGLCAASRCRCRLTSSSARIVRSIAPRSSSW
jgi:hypothetical protein